MVFNIFYNSKTAKIDSNSQISVLIYAHLQLQKTFMDILRYQCTVFIVFYIPIHYENKY